MLTAFCAFALPRGPKVQPAATPAAPKLSIGQALRVASKDSSYLLLVSGFFVCGFHLAFIGYHLPQFAVLCGLPPSAASTALSLVGGFNAVGCVLIGVLMPKMQSKYLLSAIYLTQYAAPRVRSVVKPLLEILAGVPTVVYGYFAALTLAPAIRELGISLGISSASSESALAAGLVMGVMIIPFVSSMADDSIAAVPQAMRDGSLALGATRSETIRKVLLPAALPGVVGGVLLAVSRAIGETMIVVMAAGNTPILDWNVFSGFRALSANIAVEMPEAVRDSTLYRTLFLAALTLFVMTFVINTLAEVVRIRFRRRARRL